MISLVSLRLGDGRRDCHGRRAGDHGERERGGGRVMRHSFALPLAIAMLARSMAAPTDAASLIALAARAQRRTPRRP
jgi:hypothetical protein